MDSNRKKYAAQWFYENVFRDEPIRQRNQPPAERIPSLLRTARSIENAPENTWQTREAIFWKQAKLLANYEDDYEFRGNVFRYFPTYQSLTDQELRGYFTWRTKLRRGEVQKTSLSFAFLYIYELLNQVGVADPLDGYHKLTAFLDAYGALDDEIYPYLERWLIDYIVYYDLDVNLLAGRMQVQLDHCITVLDMIREQEDAKVLYAVRQLAPKWIARSKFYAAYPEDCDAVTVRVLRRVSDHYASKTKKTMVEQLYGKCVEYPIEIFHRAVFCDPLKKRNCEVFLDDRFVYRCKSGHWTVSRHRSPLRPNRKLEDLLKTIDAVMREEYAYKHPVKYETETKWLIKIIREETQAQLAQKKQAEAKKITIDYSQLSRIRQEAAVTQEKLTVDEEEEEISPAPEAEPKEEPQSVMPSTDCPLNEAEYRLLHCLLYGESTAWVQSEGFLLSVLVDSINEKLYDTFLDSVLSDTPELIEDYIEDLKEMVTP